jgi:predicted secreted hydrolase
MWKLALSLTIIAALLIGGLILLRSDEASEVGAETMLLPNINTDISGYDRAIGPYEWDFPADHGPHPTFQTEWWYYTGNLETESGRHFGYQLTIFRRAITPQDIDSDSEWRSNQVYMGHFTITDVEANKFHQSEEYSRGAAGLAGAESDPVYHVWLENWDIQALNPEGTLTALKAAANNVAIDLELDQAKPPVLQGDHGLSQRSLEPGNASYYYSMPRLNTTGTVTINGETFSVSGATWMDHEFNTQALGSDAQGWDWFGLHLDGNRELIVGQIRLVSGSISPTVYGGMLIQPDGSTQILTSNDFTIEVTDTWTSPHSDTTYPAGWTIHIHSLDAQSFEIALTPLVADQELTEGIIYWEGAVGISGDANGYGYAELTGYQSPMSGRF